MTARWHVLTVHVPVAVDDEIATVLGEGSLGVEVAVAGPGTSRVRVYLDSLQQAERVRERARDVLAAHGIDAGDASASIDVVSDERWVERWQATLAPIPLGERFVVTRDQRPPEDGREPIRLIPGMAFGTGEHPTTRMCAAALERQVVAGSRWLDLGSGTGLLSVLAARLGAVRVLAVDIEPQAAAVAREVVDANEASSVVDVRLGSLDVVRRESFDGIVANIQSSFFLTQAAALVAALVPNGVLVASGLLVEDLPEVVPVLTAVGVRMDSRAEDGPWACLVGRRAGA